MSPAERGEEPYIWGVDPQNERPATSAGKSGGTAVLCPGLGQHGRS